MNPFKEYVAFVNEAFAKSDLPEFGHKVAEKTKDILDKTIFTAGPIIFRATRDYGLRMARDFKAAYGKKKPILDVTVIE